MPAIQLDQSTADQMLDRAVQACAGIRFRGDVPQTLQALNQGRCDICGTLSDCLVRQVGEYLGTMDRTVKAVYKCEPEYPLIKPLPGSKMATSRRGGFNLVTWVERKNAALSTLSATLENALTESRKRIPCKNATQNCYRLDIQMIEDHDVQDNRGYGLVVNNMVVRSVEIWNRSEPHSHVRPVVQSEFPADVQEILEAFDPEFAPESTLFDQAQAIEKLPQQERRLYEHKLREIQVALIRRLISDQLAYINIAKDWLTTQDLFDIYKRKIGFGRIGGKAAGMALADRILQQLLDEPLRSCIHTPESFFLGSDLIYIFMAMNGLMHWNNQKYKSEDQIRDEYPQLRAEFLRGQFPPEILTELGTMLAQIGRVPIIVRSSSLLEDNFGTSFAGKYESTFLPNQGSPTENLEALTLALAGIYASTLKPDALLYRRNIGLQDYDERMAVLVQTVQGDRYGRYYLPFGAGVAFSRNLYRWSPQIKREDGFVRLVWGLGTRAVERVGNDYSRLVALSHPSLHPDDMPEAIRYYSQQYVDLIDLTENKVKTLPFHDVIRADYPGLRFLAQVEEEGYFATPRGRVLAADIPRLAITYDELLSKSTFPLVISRMLKTLEAQYQVPVDLEFTLHMPDPMQAKPGIEISLLQCRPQSYLREIQATPFPVQVDKNLVAFTTCFMVPQGYVGNIRTVIFVTPEGYFALPTQAVRNQLRRAIGQLNVALGKKSFLCVGPGRWGTINPDLGVFVSYSDINNCAALVELSGKGVGPAPDPSLGTHFFQDLMEANIYPLAVCLDERGTIFNRDFFYNTPNHIDEYLQLDEQLASCLRVIAVEDFAPNNHLEVFMDDDQGQALAYCMPN